MLNIDVKKQKEIPTNQIEDENLILKIRKYLIDAFY